MGGSDEEVKVVIEFLRCTFITLKYTQCEDQQRDLHGTSVRFVCSETFTTFINHCRRRTFKIRPRREHMTTSREPIFAGSHSGVYVHDMKN